MADLIKLIYWKIACTDGIILIPAIAYTAIEGRVEIKSNFKYWKKIITSKTNIIIDNTSIMPLGSWDNSVVLAVFLYTIWFSIINLSKKYFCAENKITSLIPTIDSLTIRFLVSCDVEILFPFLISLFFIIKKKNE